MARYEFTMVSDAMMQGLLEAGATGGEIIAYQMLVRGLPKDRSKTECWMPADMAEAKVGMSAHTFSKMLRSLSRKAFTTAGGQPVTILTKVTRGCRGHCPHYEDTLGRLIAEGTYPPKTAAKNEPIGDPTWHPKEAPNGDPKQAPIPEFSTSEWGPKTNQLGTQNEPIGDPTGHPIKTRQDIHIVGGAAPPAQRSAAVTQPHKDESTSERSPVGTETDPARAAAGAGRRRPAAALPSRAEYDRVSRMLGEGRLEELTERDREIYHAGHKAYATNGYEPE